jgi:hypothetical protein
MNDFVVTILSRVALTVSIALGISPAAFAHPIAGDKTPQRTILITRLTALRDSFVQQTTVSGVTCPIPPPTIVLTDKASFGSYEPETNTLETPKWQQLTADERSVFFQLAGPNAETKAAREVFEGAAHRWIFIHEMGHWWQACTHANQKRQHYQVEYDANRIAAAYWRESDPNFMNNMLAGFQHMLEHTPDPVPAGQTPETYFNDNYKKLTLTPDYTWFQAQMITAVGDEKPAPTFAQALNERQ